MTDLVLCLGKGKGTWNEARRLIEAESWNKVFLITNEFGKERFQAPNNGEFVVIDDKEPLQELIKKIKSSLGNKITETEVAVNFISGGGKEHMAIISALLKLGLSIRLVAMTEKGMEEV
jgi:hypothetical protein